MADTESSLPQPRRIRGVGSGLVSSRGKNAGPHGAPIAFGWRRSHRFHLTVHEPGQLAPLDAAWDEDAVRELTALGWHELSLDKYDRYLGLAPLEVVRFFEDAALHADDTPDPRELEQLEAELLSQNDPDPVAEVLDAWTALDQPGLDMLTQRVSSYLLAELILVSRQVEAQGTLAALFSGVRLRGASIPLCHENLALNRLSFIRRLRYSTRYASPSIDLVLLVNGLPTATIQLQDQDGRHRRLDDAVLTFANPRRPAEVLFRRSAVNFAVGEYDAGAMIIGRLSGATTPFLALDLPLEDRGNTYAGRFFAAVCHPRVWLPFLRSLQEPLAVSDDPLVQKLTAGARSVLSPDATGQGAAEVSPRRTAKTVRRESVELARALVDGGWLTTPDEVIDYFSRPHRWQELWRAYGRPVPGTSGWADFLDRLDR